MRLVFIICLLAVTGFAQPIQRQFFTTNPAPDVTVIAGSNAYLSFSLIGGQTRQYKIDVPSMVGQTNNTVLSAGTNIVIVTNVSGAVTVYTVSSVPGVQTNVTLLVAGTNVFVSSATNNGVITYTIDVPTNAFPSQQTNWPWQSITNIASVQIPYAAITNPPSDIERTNWAITDITNSLNLTNWALLTTNAFTNIIVAAGSNAFVTPSLLGQVRTYTVDVPTQSGGGGSSNITDSGYIAVIRNANVQTNLNASSLTVTNPATFQNGLTNAQGLPNSLAVYGANTNEIGLANGGANTVLHGTTPPAYSGIVPADITGSYIGGLPTLGTFGTAWKFESLTMPTTASSKFYITLSMTNSVPSGVYSNICTVTYATPPPSAPIPIMTMANYSAGWMLSHYGSFYVTNWTTTGFQVAWIGVAVPALNVNSTNIILSFDCSK